ncbi:TPA: hypothetical protein EYO63_25000 [Candidatus Poribacteria bacterium]|nr:hypothetical protein [Candidatus Poribacteria bacterium]
MTLEKALIEASVELSQPKLIETVITPLMTKIGNQWQDGSLRIVNQHLASEVIRNFLVGCVQYSIFLCLPLSLLWRRLRGNLTIWVLSQLLWLLRLKAGK